jgi:phosphoenolpyruvate carboxylase
MYGRWPFFRALLDNAAMALAKADMSIARQYTTLVADAAVAEHIWTLIDAEWRRGATWCWTSRAFELLPDAPLIQPRWRCALHLRRAELVRVLLHQVRQGDLSNDERDQL